MLVLVIVLSALLFSSLVVLFVILLIAKKTAKKSFDNLIRVANLAGVDVGDAWFGEKAVALMLEDMHKDDRLRKCLREEARHRGELIALMEFVKEFQGALNAAPGIHVRKEMVLEFVGDIARHFKLEKV